MEILIKIKEALSAGASETNQEIEILRATLHPKIREGRYDSIASTIHEITEKQGELKALGKVMRLIEQQIGVAKDEPRKQKEADKEAVEAEDE